MNRAHEQGKQRIAGQDSAGLREGRDAGSEQTVRRPEQRAADARSSDSHPASQPAQPHAAAHKLPCSKEVVDLRRHRCACAPAGELSCPVFFVGFMGAGKTSVARKLARAAGVASIDMDTYIERSEGKRVKEIFAEVGEEGFRAVETRVLYELAAGEPRLISCGGGVVLAKENRDELKRAGFVVYLKVTAAEAASRIHDLSTRPLFRDLDNAQHVIDSRLPLYAEVADVTVDTAGCGTGMIARKVQRILEERGILWQRK